MAGEVKTVTPLEAWDMMKGNQRVVMIDVRSSMEYLFVGHARGSVHVPWIDAPIIALAVSITNNCTY